MMLAWNNTNNSDKIWGIVPLNNERATFWNPGKYLIFWGKRGKKLSSIIRTIDESQAQMLFKTKLNRYTEVKEQDFEKVSPGIVKEIERMLIWERIKL
jgi:D-lyxose ketol-isomerase